MTPDDAAAELQFLRHLTGWALLNEDVKRLGVAVSGGGDSMALLDLMHWHASRNEITLFAVTVDHGLRPEAKGEAAMVAGFCAKRDIPHDMLQWDWDGTGNLQAAARDARYDLIARWAKRNRVTMVMLGHTKDDIAETFLMRLARASGVDGLATMDQRFERGGIIWRRPLWQRSRADLRDYLRGQGIAWAEDPSNDDPRFERVKARGVLAALEPLGIDAATLARVADQLSHAKHALEAYSYYEARKHCEVISGDLILPTEMADRDAPIPGEVMFRLRRAALQFVSGSAYPVRRDALYDLEHALWEANTHTLQGCLVTKISGEKRWQDRWRITREYNAVKDLSCATDQVWDGRWVLDGPHDPALEIRALGDAVAQTDWRATGVPRDSQRASPSIWHRETLIAAPIAGFGADWSATLAPGRDDFAAFFIRR